MNQILSNLYMNEICCINSIWYKYIYIHISKLKPFSLKQKYDLIRSFFSEAPGSGMGIQGNPPFVCRWQMMIALSVWPMLWIWRDFGWYLWAIYNDLSRGHPKWWFSKVIPSQMALNQVKDFWLNCPDICWLKEWGWFVREMRRGDYMSEMHG